MKIAALHGVLLYTWKFQMFPELLFMRNTEQYNYLSYITSK